MRDVLNISLPEGVRAWLDGVAREAGYASITDYIRELIRTDAIRRQREAVDARLLEAINSIEAGGGESVDDVSAWTNDRKADTRRRRGSTPQ